MNFTNVTRTYSPVILNNEWSTLWRLVIMIFCTATGTIINGFFVSSFFVENPLRKIGNVYLACVGLADMLITSAVMPAAAIVLISQLREKVHICHMLQFLTQASTYTYNLLYTMVAVETYMRICRTRARYERFLKLPIGCITVVIFGISFIASGAGVHFDMDYDYCTRASFGDFTFRLCTSLLLHGIPCTCTTILLVYSSMVVRARARRLVHYRRSKQYNQDYAFTNLILGCYTLFVVAWLPYLVIVHRFPSTTDSNYYNCVWLGLSRSVITSFLFSSLNSNFRRAFSYLFYYCCCKSTVNVPFNNRHRRTYENKGAVSDVRVHIMQQATRSSPARVHSAGRSRDHNVRFICEV